ncbi:MAG: hypothetical protein ABSB63_13195 [Spirochaetia bacterium]|jgi:hypothetical protein
MLETGSILPVSMVMHMRSIFEEEKTFRETSAIAAGAAGAEIGNLRGNAACWRGLPRQPLWLSGASSVFSRRWSAPGGTGEEAALCHQNQFSRRKVVENDA